MGVGLLYITVCFVTN